MKRTAVLLLAAGCLAAVSLGSVWAQTSPDSLKSGFKNPPESAKPRVWWHWMNGNISKDGIKLDEEWMHKVGLGGFQNFDAALDTPQVVDKRLAYMTPEWKDAFKYAITLGDQLGMEMAIAGSPGWSESGGPWVPASHGMKKYVWSETRVEGGKPFTGTLPHPPTETGKFQDLDVNELSGTSYPKGLKFYADSKVVAYKIPSSEVAADALQPAITSSGGAIDPALLSDGDLVKTVLLPKAPEGEKAWIQFEYPQPQTIRSITYVVHNEYPPSWGDAGIGNDGESLEASDDGQNFHVVASIPRSGAPENTIDISPATAKYFRVTFKTLPAPANGREEHRSPVKNVRIAELVLHPDARVNHFEAKAAFDIEPDLYGYATTPVAPSDAIQKSDVIDLTSKMHPDGTLDWTPPAGEWEVIRFGYSLIGTTNHPATAEATGLEVDKLNRAEVKDYFEKYLDSYKQTIGADQMGKRGIRYVINDSYEAGAQNWTDNMIADFTRLRGYDPTPWLPVLAGRVVASSEASDRFLWDFRKTLSDLMAEEHYHTLEEVLHEWGMGHYGESHEGGRALIADGMEVKKWNEVPMSAMWTQTPGVNHEQYDYNADDRESASVAHIYGQNLAAAESMTAYAAPWAWSPATLKPTADQEFINGINRFVIHESAHQPLIGKAPGLSLGPFGQWFNRNETWAQQATPWISYIARTSFMLQQGRFGADLIYFYGEDSNLTAIFNEKSPNVPAGYGFDYVNADAIIHALSVANGRIATPGGMSYRLLGLDPYSQHMSLPVLRAIHKLVEAGAVVAGPKPGDDPSLADNQAEFNKLNDELFGDGTGTHKVGKGTVYAGQNLGDVFAAMNVKPDFDYTKPEADTRLEFVHRKLAGADLYFVDNRSDNPAVVDATFRVGGKAPELWHAEDGSSSPATFTIADGRTTVPLKLEPWGTVFVVFRKPTSQTSFTAPEKAETQIATVEGPWTVSFQTGRGAPPSITLDTLSSWSDNQDSGVKYFSGAGTYTKSIDASPDWFKNGAHVWIDLGDVKNLAEVTVNGKSLGIVWHAPYRVDATAALKPGANEVKIMVINAWVNRLIGDMQPDATTKYTFTTSKPYEANSPLQLSGLLGPVNVYSVTTK
ncbi:MAG: glycosyl hydrolase [Terracidiphilus sp.]|jgi:hypothetical protein